MKDSFTYKEIPWFADEMLMTKATFDRIQKLFPEAHPKIKESLLSKCEDYPIKILSEELMKGFEVDIAIGKKDLSLSANYTIYRGIMPEIKFRNFGDTNISKIYNISF